MVEIVLPRASVELLCKTAELSLNKVNTASVSSLSLRLLSAKHFPIRLFKKNKLLLTAYTISEREFVKLRAKWCNFPILIASL